MWMLILSSRCGFAFYEIRGPSCGIHLRRKQPSEARGARPHGSPKGGSSELDCCRPMSSPENIPVCRARGPTSSSETCTLGETPCFLKGPRAAPEAGRAGRLSWSLGTRLRAMRWCTAETPLNLASAGHGGSRGHFNRETPFPAEGAMALGIERAGLQTLWLFKNNV